MHYQLGGQYCKRSHVDMEDMYARNNLQTYINA